MSDPQEHASWRQALPGWLAALAAVIIVIGGFVALLFQFGILGSSQSDDVRARPAPPPAVAMPAPAPSAPAQALAPVDKRTGAEVAVLTRDGTTTRLRASSLSSCNAAAHGLSLDNGQSIPFERMAGFEVHHSDPHAAPDAKARLLVELLDGKKVQATVAAACELSGESMEGRFLAYFEGIRSARFER